MSDVRSRRFHLLSPPAISSNSEKIPVEAANLSVPAPASTSLDEQYGYIGGRHGGNVVKCLLAGNEELTQTTNRQHALNRALVVICWHLAQKIIHDDVEYEVIMDLPRWKDRHIKPKLDDDLAARCRFIAILMFSDSTGHNDNSASKNGRIVAQLIKSGVGEDSIVEHLSRTGGVGRVYEEALANGSVMGDGGALPDASMRPGRTSSTRKNASSGTPAKLVYSDPVQALKRLVARIADHVDLEPSIILAGVNDHAMFAETNPGEELQLIAKRVDHGGDCVVFHVSQARPADETR